MIPAIINISLSEIQVVKPWITPEWIEDNKDEFQSYLYELGIDIKKPIEVTTNAWHRNRLNKVVISDRYMGYERSDLLWLNSGYASKEAKDKASNSKLLEDLYKRKGYSI